MKKICIVALALLLMSMICYGAVIKTSVENSLGTVIKRVRTAAIMARNTLNNSKVEGIDIIQHAGGEFDQADKDNMQLLKIEIENTTASLDNLITYIETNWGGIDL